MYIQELCLLKKATQYSIYYIEFATGFCTYPILLSPFSLHMVLLAFPRSRSIGLESFAFPLSEDDDGDGKEEEEDGED